MSQMSCPNFTVMAVLQQLSHLSYHVPAALSFYHVLAILPSLSCPVCTISILFSGCPVLAVLPKLSCPSNPSPVFLSPALDLLSYSYCPVLFVLSYMSCPGAQSWKSYTDCPVLAVHGCPYMADKKFKNSFSRGLKASVNPALKK
jgi:hypothetical protein